ncbi:family 16 glycosylhydrolase [Dysgonomonas sp. 520]|uniref:family 16 glycosylhydrolase n=1 Tax=Dysgonomonas sp. 520 TaxID=2302931 RepID=UPI0013D58A30|nr:family 16 glycosylhydrolase [Dysgonomonas sp. 520]NDW08729.1 glycoside hydrolase family 16 protein [Dysgonomonas sp. 520]
MNYKYLLAAILISLVSVLSCSDSDKEEEVVAKITLNKTETTIEIGGTETLVATLSTSTTEPVVWTSSDEYVATVFHGIVTAITSGEVTITATVGSISASCVVTVPQKEYKLVWSDDFDGTALNTEKWRYETGGNGWGNQELQYYTDRTDNVRLEDGYLIIEAKKENQGNNKYTSGRIITKGKAQFTYGKMEARISLPSGNGTWPAFWMLGTRGGWPGCGEIDIMEHVGKEPTMISHALHTANRNGMNGKNWNSKDYFQGVEGSFHTYGVEWIEKEDRGFDCIKFFVDGVETATCFQGIDNRADWPFNNEFFLILNVAIGGSWGGTVDDSIFDKPVQMKVDWVKVYQLQ